MTRKEIVILVVAVLLVAALLGAAAYVIKSQAALGQLLKDQGEIIKAAQQKHDDAKKDEKQVVTQEASRVSDLAQALTRIASAKQQPVDLDDLARRIQERMGIQATVQKSASSLPDAPSAVTLEAKPLRDYMSDCDAAKLEGQSCKLGLANKDRIIADKQVQLDAAAEITKSLTKERDAAVKASKGGGFFSRLKSGSKYFVIGAIAGGTAAALAKR